MEKHLMNMNDIDPKMLKIVKLRSPAEVARELVETDAGIGDLLKEIGKLLEDVKEKSTAESFSHGGQLNHPDSSIYIYLDSSGTLRNTFGLKQMAEGDETDFDGDFSVERSCANDLFMYYDEKDSWETPCAQFGQEDILNVMAFFNGEPVNDDNRLVYEKIQQFKEYYRKTQFWKN